MGDAVKIRGFQVDVNDLIGCSGINEVRKLVVVVDLG